MKLVCILSIFIYHFDISVTFHAKDIRLKSKNGLIPEGFNDYDGKNIQTFTKLQGNVDDQSDEKAPVNEAADTCVRRCCFIQGLPIKCLEEKLESQAASIHNGTHVHVGMILSMMCLRYESILQKCTAECFDEEEVPDGCHWGDFGGWSGCSKDCGGGRRTRVRTRRRMPLTGSTRGNGACKGYGVETEACNSHDCRESNSSDLTKHMFNETCCLEKGVPQECIGNCQGARNSGMGLRMGLLQTRCTRFEKTINGCIVNLSDDPWCKYVSCNECGHEGVKSICQRTCAHFPDYPNCTFIEGDVIVSQNLGETTDPNLEHQCTLGCEKCEYNWYKRNWNNGQPNKYFQNRDCGCCQIGGDTKAFDECAYYCTGRSPQKEDLHSESQCTLGCEKCGYNWYERNWKNGQPTTQFHNRDCGCCQIGGDTSAFDDCTYYCTGRNPPKEDPSLENQCTLGCEKCGYNWYERNWKNGQPTTQLHNRDCGCCQIGGDTSAFDDCTYYCTGRNPPKEDPSLENQCTLGCEKCGYNWYEA